MDEENEQFDEGFPDDVASQDEEKDEESSDEEKKPESTSYGLADIDDSYVNAESVAGSRESAPVLTKYEWDMLVGARAKMIEANHYFSPFLLEMLALRGIPNPNALDISEAELRRTRRIWALVNRGGQPSVEELKSVGLKSLSDDLVGIIFPIDINRRMPNGEFQRRSLKQLISLEELEILPSHFGLLDRGHTNARSD